MNHYEQKQEERRERLQARAAKRITESNAAHGKAKAFVEMVPFGQPVLVGHHSEKRHRADIARFNGNMQKAVDLNKEAQELERRAEAVGTGGISSDDPDAVTKLKAQLDKLTKLQDIMKNTNAALRKGDDAALAALGFSPEKIAQRKQPDCFGGIGFPSFSLSNNNANIRRIEKRIEELTKRDSAPAFDPVTGNGWRCELLKDDNRIAFYFDSVPPENTRKTMKSHGFKWSPTRGAWIRQNTPNARYATSRIIEQFNLN